MKLEVPYYSQYLDVQDENRKPRACAITCLKMVLDFYAAPTKTVDELFVEGQSIGGMTEKGWKQDAIVILLHNYGVAAYREEFRSNDEDFSVKLLELGKKKIIDSLVSGNPVGISVFSKNGAPHLVVFTGVEMESGVPLGFYYNDPEAHTIEEGRSLFMSTEEFEKGWRRFAIFPYKS